jgi:hypothetical protein
MLLDTGAPPQYTPEEWLRVLETLAGAEASVSWLIWNNTLPCFWARFLDDEGRARVFGDSSRVFAGSTRPTGRAVTTPGGFRLSGRWSLVSGCELADYVHLMSLVHEEGVPRMRAPGQSDLRVLFVPKGRYAILDTWHVGGLRGSGSHDVVVDDVFVPVEDSFAPAPPVASHSPLAQLPIVPMMVPETAEAASLQCGARVPAVKFKESSKLLQDFQKLPPYSSRRVIAEAHGTDECHPCRAPRWPP